MDVIEPVLAHALKWGILGCYYNWDVSAQFSCAISFSLLKLMTDRIEKVLKRIIFCGKCESESAH